ncbi:hypothetical protein SPI_00115 [Niveomyces insectorum RCEF 264]|uniref:Mucoidy inhibitor-like protein n=1 Tax=Niveomyces insectorum RCEF 264 TaxID=1081102 RepID=A0A167ZUH3_9HYPO|nr:hypothetical protein SPI_00115 [Niveomyces insectorum RCEF 264]
MDSVHKQEFRVRDLPTRSVTLFPTRAQVVRDIKDVSLEPGVNQITIVGLSPTVDENSIKVEGTGAAIISDIAVELLPNREFFDDVYPDDDDDDKSGNSDDGDDDDDDDEPSLPDGSALGLARRQLVELLDHERHAEEQVESAEARQKILDTYGSKMFDRKRDINIDVGIEKYRAERARAFQDRMNGEVRLRSVREQIRQLREKEARLLRQQTKDRAQAAREAAQARRAKEKEREKARRRAAAARAEKLRVRRERERYWPRQCYTVRITLDATTLATPSLSRRTSLSSVTEMFVAAAGDENEKKQDHGDKDAGGASANNDTIACDLAISYVTSSAGWSPTYDLQLSTTTNTAVLCFDAQLSNTTAETWTNCKVVLSTSQTTFSGLSDAIPTLVSWHVKLAKGRGYDGLLRSREESAQTITWQAQQHGYGGAHTKPRKDLFGRDKGGYRSLTRNPYAQPVPEIDLQLENQAVRRPQQQLPIQEQLQMHGHQQHLRTRSAVPPPPRLAAPAPFPVRQALVRPTVPQTRRTVSSIGGFGSRGGGGRYEDAEKEVEQEEEEEEDSEDEDDDDAETLPQELAFQESAFEETGMTTTYDLPGLKTLAPGSVASKQRVARVNFAHIAFSHTVVAKYRPAAYLKARLRNAGQLTLLRGAAGLTLDGAFLGRATLPRCSPGDQVTLNLGVNPAIRVAYTGPAVKRATTGLFTKEDSSAYTRTITLTNTRKTSGTGNGNSSSNSNNRAAAILLVLDQVPVSEDEKLRVEIQQPRGLMPGHGVASQSQSGELAVATGVGVGVDANGSSTTPAAKADWGAAKATLKKGGEIVWDVKLNAGRSVRLDLAYDVSAPAGEGVVQV